ncbi:hypothetical protein N7495_005226 [Penicillium taxi]|uniref:uncharacterized protein n=1 Tax=Penicillium taxi TaxID=168475 RepID=UPI002545B413|nr:uncharacterized protein N7495_005226 [Penicillium taxi]KAJ5893535.1 hypothetical protein N7495_005226 [Penicillium taxi]
MRYLCLIFTIPPLVTTVARTALLILKAASAKHFAIFSVVTAIACLAIIPDSLTALCLMTIHVNLAACDDPTLVLLEEGER